MSKIIFVTIPEKGHINPMIGTAQYLQKKGYEVFFVSEVDITQYLENYELKFCNDILSSKTNELLTGKELVEIVQNKEKLSVWVKELLCSNIEIAIEKYKRFFKKSKADCIVVDPLLYAPAIAAHLLGVPWVALSNSLNPIIPSSLKSDLLDTATSLDAFRTQLVEQYLLSTTFRGCDILSPHLNIAFTTPFVSDYTKSDINQVGPALVMQDSQKSFMRRYKERPLIYASFGSQVYYWPIFFKRLIQSCEDLSVELVISIGDLVEDESFKDLPNWVHSYQFAPQLDILKEADLFITHGGANSFMESIYTNTPMILNPICNDQFHQAYFLKKKHFGIEQNITDHSTKKLQSLILECLNSNDWHKGLQQAYESYQINGSLHAASLIENLC